MAKFTDSAMRWKKISRSGSQDHKVSRTRSAPVLKSWDGKSDYEKWVLLLERHESEAKIQMERLGRVLFSTRAMIDLARKVIHRSAQPVTGNIVAVLGEAGR